MKEKTFDIIIAGGGMVGLSLAAMLPDTLQVALIDRFPLPEDDSPLPQPSFDSRSTALSYQSVQIFKSCGIWPLIQPFVESITKVHVSDKGYLGSAMLSAEQKGWEALGFVIENAILGRQLLHAVRHKSNVTLLCPARVKEIKPLQEGCWVAYEERASITRLKAALVVVADGAQSTLCESLGIRCDVTDYRHKAIIANVSAQLPHEGMAFERFTKKGPLALLPLPSIGGENRLALIWTLPEGDADDLLALPDADFLGALQKTFGQRLGRFIKLGKRGSHPLKLTQAVEQVRNEVIVLGNAAHSLHPVAGQGFNLALRDSAALCDSIVQAVEENDKIGSLKVLKRYFEQQQNDQRATVVFSDKLPELFSKQIELLNVLNTLGLVSLDILPKAKSRFIEFAAGVRKSSVKHTINQKSGAK